MPIIHGSISDFGKNISFIVEDRLNEIGDNVCKSMKEHLMQPNDPYKEPHRDTGALLGSIRQETENYGDKVVTNIYADAQSESGAFYAEFLEYGSGEFRKGGGGATEPWRYKDANDQWHTTTGMHADPFIEPSVNENVPTIGYAIAKDIEKYARMNEGGLIDHDHSNWF